VSRIIAAFAYRYEPDWLIDELRQNLSWVDGFAELDDRDRTEPWGVNADRVKQLMAIARAMEPDWIFYTAPDERLEDRAADVLREVAERPGGTRYSFRLREMWRPDAYRVDGVWGRKLRARFFRPGELHSTRALDLNIYHLKMIEPENRRERRRVHTAHNRWDNKRRGFAYMTDERGLRLEAIPDGRGFTPAYQPYRFEVAE
jgi:hypothetical protein